LCNCRSGFSLRHEIVRTRGENNRYHCSSSVDFPVRDFQRRGCFLGNRGFPERAAPPRCKLPAGKPVGISHDGIRASPAGASSGKAHHASSGERARACTGISHTLQPRISTGRRCYLLSTQCWRSCGGQARRGAELGLRNQRQASTPRALCGTPARKR